MDNLEIPKHKLHRKIRKATLLPSKSGFDEDINFKKADNVEELNENNYDVLESKLNNIDQKVVFDRNKLLEMKCLLESNYNEEWAESDEND